MKNNIPCFCRKFGKVTQNLSSAAVMIGTLRVKCYLLMTFVNNLDPDQARHFVRPDLDPNCLTL